MCFVHVQCHFFLEKTVRPQNWSLISFGETHRNKIMDIVRTSSGKVTTTTTNPRNRSSFLIFSLFLFDFFTFLFSCFSFHFFVFPICSFLLLFQIILFSCFSSFFFFSFFHLLFDFQSSEQTPKPEKNRRTVQIVKNDDFLL